MSPRSGLSTVMAGSGTEVLMPVPAVEVVMDGVLFFCWSNLKLMLSTLV